jgi:hypothetical protein
MMNQFNSNQNVNASVQKSQNGLPGQLPFYNVQMINSQSGNQIKMMDYTNSQEKIMGGQVNTGGQMNQSIQHLPKISNA